MSDVNFNPTEYTKIQQCTKGGPSAISCSFILCHRLLVYISSEKPMGWSYLKAGTIGGEQFQELRDFNNTKFSYLK